MSIVTSRIHFLVIHALYFTENEWSEGGEGGRAVQVGGPGAGKSHLFHELLGHGDITGARAECLEQDR